MTRPDAMEYFERRERQERARAEAASDRAIRAIHLEMAARYSELTGETAPVLRIVD